MMNISGLQSDGSYAGMSMHGIINDKQTKDRYPFGPIPMDELDSAVGKFGGFAFSLIDKTLLHYVSVGAGTLVVLKADVDAVCVHIQTNILTDGQQVLDLENRVNLAGTIWTLVKKYVGIFGRHQDYMGNHLTNEIRGDVILRYPVGTLRSGLSDKNHDGQLIGVAWRLIQRVVTMAPDSIDSRHVPMTLRDTIAQRLHAALLAYNGGIELFRLDRFTHDVLSDTLLFIQKELASFVGDDDEQRELRTIQFDTYDGQPSVPLVIN